ncbi:hypothetical protein ACHAPT_013257 [Fusarium lateritium]
MPEQGRANPVRLRASRACQACSSRKVRCDATEIGLPCSRCRVNKSPNCFLVASRRGTYPRKQHKEQTRQQSAMSPSPVGSGSAASDRDPSAPAQPGSVTYSPSSSLDSTHHNVEGDMGVSEPPQAVEGLMASADDGHTQQRDSLASMFERFLEQQGQSAEDATSTCGIIFMSDASPLTFALEEARDRNNKPVMHDADSHFSKADRAGTVDCADHPAHLSPQDVAYLRVKGAFERPTEEVLTAMVAAFVESAGTLPWILLHAVCFIGSTFCDPSVIYRAGFKSRWHARRQFYDKAKLLFDIGYETNKIVLLQCVIMLSFWGPQMKSYWNPCSWVGFGVTIAESLGIHRMSTSTRVDRGRKSLLKRLFWVLAVRDAYCATLLGRPCRLNMAQCDTEPLDLDDFGQGGNPQDQDRDKSQAHAHYLIQLSTLSLILRSIVETRFGPGKNASMAAHLHGQLDAWMAELPPCVNWTHQQQAQARTTDIFSLSLKTIFHLQLILTHLENPDEAASSSSLLPGAVTSSCQITESAAHVISSTAFTIIANSMLGVMPHEVFSGFFVAGIVFYRGIKNPHGALSHLPRSALDNCQMVISEARGRWDPANWVLRIFDFLLSSNSSSSDTADYANQEKQPAGSGNHFNAGAVSFLNDTRVLDMLSDDDMLHSIDFGSPTNLGVGSLTNELFPLSSYLPLPSENPSFEAV